MNSRSLLTGLGLLILGSVIWAQTFSSDILLDRIVDMTALRSDSAITDSEPVVLADTTVRLPKLEFDGASLSEALRALARSHNLSLFVDSSVVGTLTVRLDNVRLNDALLFILDRYGLSYERVGQILRVYKPRSPAVTPAPLSMTFEDGNLSCDLQEADLRQLTRELSEKTGYNIILGKNLRGTVNGKLVDLPFERALPTLMSANGYVASMADGIWYVLPDTARGISSQPRRMNIRCDSGLVTLEAWDVSLGDVLAALGSQCQATIVVQGQIEGRVTLSTEALSLERVFLAMLISTPYTFKRVGNEYFVGLRESETLFESRLISLRYETAAAVEPLIPAMLLKSMVVKRVPEHNGLLVTGPRTGIEQIEQLMSSLDKPVAQVLFEVLVVDYSTTDRTEFSLIANNFGGDSGRPGETYYPNVDLNRTGKEMNRDLESISRDLGISNLGTLPQSFFARLRILVQQGRANVRSQPQIATLNGHSASIKIGTTQYYLLKSETIYPSTQTSLTTQTTQRFEKIDADLSLEVTPYVSQDGFVTVDVNPVFNSPAGAFDPETPPTINRRELKSTVRLHDGETIVLGGLVEQTRGVTIDKLPILGSLPLLGRLFQNRSAADRSSTLMIYITPRVYFGSEGSVKRDSVLTLQR